MYLLKNNIDERKQIYLICVHIHDKHKRKETAKEKQEQNLNVKDMVSRVL